MPNSSGRKWRTGSPKGALLTFLKLCIAVGLVIYLIHRGHIAWDALLATMNRWQYSIPALLVLALTPLGQLWRWQSLLRASHLNLPTREVFSYLMVAKFLNMALPGYIGGDVIRGVYVSRRASGQPAMSRSEPSGNDSPGATAVLPSIVFDRGAGVLPLLAMALAGSVGAFWYSLPDGLLFFVTAFASAALLAALGIFWLAYRHPQPPQILLRVSGTMRLRRYVLAFYEGCRQYVRNLGLIRTVLGISFLNQGLILLSFVLLGTALDLKIPLISYLVLVPLGLLITAIPISPAGLGVGQVAFLALFQMAGTSQGANLFTLYMAGSVLVNCTGALILPFFRLRVSLQPAANLASAEEPRA